MAGTESDLRRAADARLAEAKKAGSDEQDHRSPEGQP